jgi:hypothetical protein
MAAKKGKKKAKGAAPAQPPKKAAVHRDAEELKREVRKLPVKVGKDVAEKAAHEMAQLHVKRADIENERAEAMRGFK